MDIFYFGRRGSGKTCRAVIDLLMDWYDGNEMWTNTPLHPAFDINYKTRERGNLHVIDAIDLIRLLLEEDDSNGVNPNTQKTLLLDEIKTQANSGQYASFVNRNLTNFVSQARKLNFRIIYTDQLPKSYDVRLRQMTDKIVYCQPFIDATDLGYGNTQYPEPIYFGYTEIEIDSVDYQKPKAYWISRATARNFYPLYDTKKRITPVELKHGEDAE